MHFYNILYTFSLHLYPFAAFRTRVYVFSTDSTNLTNLGYAWPQLMTVAYKMQCHLRYNVLVIN